MLKVDVKDLVVGQEVLAVWPSEFSGKNDFETLTVKDEYVYSRPGTEYFLLNDVQKPVFVVPWGTRQVDKNGDVWEFFEKYDQDGYIAGSGGFLLDSESAARCTPFHRLYTITELVEALRDGRGSENYDLYQLPIVLADLDEEGVI